MHQIVGSAGCAHNLTTIVDAGRLAAAATERAQVLYRTVGVKERDYGIRCGRGAYGVIALLRVTGAQRPSATTPANLWARHD
jgi:hypothetical protein